MMKDDKIINALMYGDIIQKLAEERNIGTDEARKVVSEMSFKEYRALDEASADIVPPSGQKISSAAPVAKQSAPAVAAPTPTPPKAGPAAGVNDPRGVQVKNPVTGKMEWMTPTEEVSENTDLARMRQLAGIQENSSCGASCAGAIASAPAPMGKVKRREPTNEQQPVEYTRTEAPKTIVGDTKPAQASGELSANLAARGKRTASRTNNGLRR